MGEFDEIVKKLDFSNNTTTEAVETVEEQKEDQSLEEDQENTPNGENKDSEITDSNSNDSENDQNNEENSNEEENTEEKETPQTRVKIKTSDKEPAEDSEAENPIESLKEEEKIALINKLIEGNFNSLTDLKQVLTQQDIDDPEVAALYKWKKETGRPLETYFTTQTKNYQEMSDEEVLIESEMLKHGYSREDAKLLVEDAYSIDEDATENEKRIANLKKNRAANMAKKDLLAMQQQFKKPAPQQKKEDTSQKMAQEIERFNSDLQNNLSEENPLVLSVESNDSEIDFELDPNMMNELKKDVRYDYFQQVFTKEDGSFDTDGFIGIIALHQNLDAFVNKIVESTLSQQREKNIQEKKNINHSPEKQVNTGQVTFNEAMKNAIKNVR